MPKTPLTAEGAYRLFNRILPDDGALALANVVFELHEGMLAAVDAAAAAEADDEADLAAAIGHCDLNGTQFCYKQLFAKGVSQAPLLRLAIEAIRAVPSGSIEEEASEETELSYPTTIAVAAVWHKDGRVWSVLYHHPKVTARLAAAILKEVIDDLEIESIPTDEETGSKN